MSGSNGDYKKEKFNIDLVSLTNVGTAMAGKGPSGKKGSKQSRNKSDYYKPPADRKSGISLDPSASASASSKPGGSKPGEGKPKEEEEKKKKGGR